MTTYLDSLLPADHAARAVWAYVLRQDLSVLYDAIRARTGHAGRPAIDPQILLALWLLATLEGVGSARELDRLCGSHVAYQWIVGGVGVNHHALSDFRTEHVALLEALLVRGVAALMAGGLVALNQVAQDGMRVRASAGADTFRRRETLEECLKLAREQVRKLREELDADPAGANRRREAAQRRAAEEREARLVQALDELARIEAKRAEDEPKTPKPPAEPPKPPAASSAGQSTGETSPSEPSEPPPPGDPPPPADPPAAREAGKKPPPPPRASPTDPEARRMKMADGGFRPAYNVQFATIDILAPVPKPKDPDRDPYKPLPGDAPGVADWRTRMGTEAAKQAYTQRAATAECVNALARQRGLQQLPVRG